MINEPITDHNGAKTGRVFPYIVELDSPSGKMISVPEDAARCVVAETCWPPSWAATGPLPAQAPKPRPALRFAVGDAVMCLVGDYQYGAWSSWCAGVVTALWRGSEAWGSSEVAAYEIQLNVGGSSVLAHRDDHTLVRDPALQQQGPKAAGPPAASRFGKRQREDGAWESVDQQTRHVRACAPAPAPAPSPAPDSAPDSPVPTPEQLTEPWLLCGECE